MVDFAQEKTKLDSILRLTGTHTPTLRKIFTDQRRLLRSPNSMWYQPTNFFAIEDGGSFRQRDDPKDTDTVKTLQQKSEVSEPALVKGSSFCVKSVCKTLHFGGIYQNWIPLRKSGTLQTERKPALHGSYAEDYKLYLSDVYGLDTSTLPNCFFNSIFNVDHLIPSGWLMRPRKKRGFAKDPRCRVDDPTELKEASELEELVDYVSVALVPSAINKSWGTYEGKLKRNLERQNSKGGANLIALAKAAGIPCRRPAEDETHWMARLYKTLASLDFLPVEEARTLLEMLNSENFTTVDWNSLEILESSPLSTAWLEVESTVPAEAALDLTEINRQQTREVICEFTDGVYFVRFNDTLEILTRHNLAQGKVLEVVKNEAHRMANILLLHYSLPPVNSLQYTYYGLPKEK